MLQVYAPGKAAYKFQANFFSLVIKGPGLLYQPIKKRLKKVIFMLTFHNIPC